MIILPGSSTGKPAGNLPGHGRLWPADNSSRLSWLRSPFFGKREVLNVELWRSPSWRKSGWPNGSAPSDWSNRLNRPGRIQATFAITQRISSRIRFVVRRRFKELSEFLQISKEFQAENLALSFRLKKVAIISRRVLRGRARYCTVFPWSYLWKFFDTILNGLLLLRVEVEDCLTH